MDQAYWEARAKELKAEMEDRTIRRGPDDYYAVKDAYWEAVAKAKRTSQIAVNPMGFWFGGPSN